MTKLPKRFFNSKIDNYLENLIEKLPQGNFASIVVALNLLFYSAYVFWPKYSMHSYLNNFSFSMYGFNNGYYHNLLTCHFAHQSLFSCLLDSVLLFMFSGSIIQQNGPLFVAKTLILSLLMGSFYLFLYHNTQKGMIKPFQGNDALWRGIVFSMVFKNP